MKSIGLFFDLMDYEYLVSLIESKNIIINGFTNIKKAPKNLLKNVIKIKYNNEKKFQELIDDIFCEKSKDYIHLSLDDFLSEFYISSWKEKYTIFEIYGIFLSIFPKEAENLSDKIEFNIKNGKHIFSGLINENVNINDGNCISIIKKYLDINNIDKFIYDSIIKIEEVILELNKMEEYNFIQDKIKNKSIVEICKEFGDLSEQLDNNLFMLAFVKLNLDYAKEDNSILVFFKDIILNAMENIYIQYKEYKNNQIEVLKLELNNKENSNISLNKKLFNCSIELNCLKDEINEKNILNKRLKEKIMKNTTFKLEEEKPDLILVTNYLPDRILDSIGNYLMINPENIKDYKSIIKNFKGLVYIDRGSISSTKNLLLLEDYFIKVNIKAKTIFAKNIEELVKRIIIDKFALEV